MSSLGLELWYPGRHSREQEIYGGLTLPRVPCTPGSFRTVAKLPTPGAAVLLFQPLGAPAQLPGRALECAQEEFVPLHHHREQPTGAQILLSLLLPWALGGCFPFPWPHVHHHGAVWAPPGVLCKGKRLWRLWLPLPCARSSSWPPLHLQLLAQHQLLSQMLQTFWWLLFPAESCKNAGLGRSSVPGMSGLEWFCTCFFFCALWNHLSPGKHKYTFLPLVISLNSFFNIRHSNSEGNFYLSYVFLSPGYSNITFYLYYFSYYWT